MSAALPAVSSAAEARCLQVLEQDVDGEVSVAR